MKKVMIVFAALLFAGSISAHGCYGRGHVSVGFYAPQVCAPRVIVERPVVRYYDPYAYGYRPEYRGVRGCHEQYYRGNSRRYYR